MNCVYNLFSVIVLLSISSSFNHPPFLPRRPEFSSVESAFSDPKAGRIIMDASPTRPPVPPRSNRAPLPQPQQPTRGHFRASALPAIITTDASTVPTEKVPHDVRSVFFRTPQYCAHCSDFIWGAGHRRGVHCQRCRRCFHSECALFLVHAGSCPGPASTSTTAAEVFAEDYPVDRWSVDTILQWLAATNLFLYADHFRANLGHLKSLRHLDAETLQRWRIHNEDHRLALLLAIDVLYASEEAFSDPRREGMSHRTLWVPAPPLDVRDCVHPASAHRLTLTTLAGPPRACFKCGVVLWGHVKQGMACLDCGRAFHRSCAATGLPPCSSTGSLMQPTLLDDAASGARNAGFGLALTEFPENLLTSSVKGSALRLPTGVPLVVYICATEMERRGRSEAVDLFQVYENSALDKADDVVAAFKRCHNLQSFLQVREREREREREKERKREREKERERERH